MTVVFFRTHNDELIHKVCRYLGVPPYLSINRTTRVGKLTQEQRTALEPLCASGAISIRNLFS